MAEVNSGGARPLVALRRCPDYETEHLPQTLSALLDDLGGMSRFVGSGESIALKVNMLIKSAPKKAVTTQPEVLSAVIDLVKAAGGRPFVCESPAGINTASSMRRSLEATGVGEVCRRHRVPFVTLDDDVVEVAVPDAARYHTLRLGRAIVEADGIISLPRLKTHSFQRFTGAVKILFGSVAGLEKAQFHLKTPDRMDFAHMLVDVLTALRPRLAIMDAIVAMEGEGPSGGSPRKVGALLGGADHLAVDAVAARLISMDPMSVYTLRAARERGLLGDPAQIELAGDLLEPLIVRDFLHPMADLSSSRMGSVGPVLKNIATARPLLERPDSCTSCATCRHNCPVQAIKMVDGHPTFDYDTCIRCYCCQEVCPEAAIGRRSHWLVRPFIRG
jgi:uncharacterized protein (DUF362 family)/Pyruvate/2-oxoacid:ferredoxin oxidoreductase delta subunit